ncbi:hypothetical protein M3N64_06395 [Sporolactobacillus sp. CPB3-1]|uniref:DUF3006 domain-containing protein n=1 Tax=Sporolactobacillus mangiferae TaxID=2940498 RepID=A0ABT0M9M9_9BACL|nr:hypothetical protein [Sporolactobacillus mangiferae]MCL1631578.1 hypothetical protein [Sporolactobacillus mangiferae]
MHEHTQFMNEKVKIDQILQRSYLIISIEENLSGTFVTVQPQGEQESPPGTVHLVTADGRRYLTSRLFERKRVHAQKSENTAR